MFEFQLIQIFEFLILHLYYQSFMDSFIIIYTFNILYFIFHNNLCYLIIIVKNIQHNNILIYVYILIHVIKDYVQIVFLIIKELKKK